MTREPGSTPAGDPPRRAAAEAAAPNLAARAGGWSVRHRRASILGWFAFVVIAFAAGTAVGQRYLTDVQAGNGESKQATAVYERAFPYHTGEQVLVQGQGAVRIGTPALASAVDDLIRRLRSLPTVNDIRSPLLPANRMLRSADGRSMLVTFNVAGDYNQAQTNVRAALAATAATARAHPGVRVEEFGAASANRALADAFISDAKKAEYTSVPVTLIVLVFAFGSVVAAGIPLLLGITAVMATLGLIGPFSQLLPVSAGQIDAVVALIGLAVGVDYSMFYLRRKLEERRAGLSNERALARAAATSGRAVLVSGLTVMTAMAGMFLAGNAVFSSLAMGTMLVVAVAVLGSVTVLPAVISKLGDNVERGRAPFIARRRARGRSRAWAFVIDQVLRVPALSLVLSAGLLIALAVPALSMHTVNPGMVGLPPNLPIMRTYDRIQRAFPGGPLPALVVVSAADVNAPAVQRGIARMARTALATGQMAGPVVVSVSQDRTVAAVTISLAGRGTDRRSDQALTTLRRSVIPATVGAVPGVRAYVGGTTAASRDFTDTMKAHLPLVFGFVLGLAFVLLLITFRSLVIPLMTIVLNLISVGAAYGVVTLVFQHGYLRGALGAQDISGIIDWLPLFLFVVLFGLSMDYHVLILSRIREAHATGLATAEAVGEGIKSTAGVVTSAAVVMVAVFSIFALLPEVIYKQLGVGLAAAVLIDATVVRAVLLPSTMKLLGERNWYLPRWAASIHVRHHPPAAPGPA
ncbi:MAG TPA: MMPL family transporter [Solirubrobacteraceae bacterium]|nr:MMPL family transporter [Solirubrobacteraceae bacterium]